MATGRLYKKISAAILLLCLLCTTVVQLTHTHAGVKTVSAKIIKADTNKTHYTLSSADAKCFLCEYQLAKDADLTISFLKSNKVYKTPVKETVYTEKVFSLFDTVTESRGPPAITSAA